MKVALVAPRDRSCRAVAEQMAARATVEVLTTCLGPEPDSGEFHDPGVSRVGGVTLRRFRNDYPRVAELERRSATLVRSGEADLVLQERWMQERGPYSSALFDHLSACRGHFDAFVFFVLESATTVFGLPLVGPAVLTPQVNDWELMRAELLRSTAARARGFVFASEDERRGVQEIVSGDVPHALARGTSGAPYLEMARLVSEGSV